MVAFIRTTVVARVLLTLLRFWVGLEWVDSAVHKLGSSVWTGAEAGTAVTGFLTHAVSLAHGAHPAVQGWYANLIQVVALPNATMLSYLISWGELVIGVALICGCFTTFAACMGAILNTLFMLAGTTSINPNMLILEMFIMVGGFNAAIYGLDFWLIPRFRKLWGYEVNITGDARDKVH